MRTESPWNYQKIQHTPQYEFQEQKNSHHLLPPIRDTKYYREFLRFGL